MGRNLAANDAVNPCDGLLFSCRPVTRFTPFAAWDSVALPPCIHCAINRPMSLGAQFSRFAWGAAPGFQKIQTVGRPLSGDLEGFIGHDRV